MTVSLMTRSGTATAGYASSRSASTAAGASTATASTQTAAHPASTTSCPSHTADQTQRSTSGQRTSHATHHEATRQTIRASLTSVQT